jgi:hypothetical protein
MLAMFSSFPPPLSRLPPCLDDSESVNHHPLLRLPFCCLTLIAGVHPTALAPFFLSSSLSVFLCPPKQPGPGPCVVYFGLFCSAFAFILRGRFGAELLFESLPFGRCVALRCVALKQ